MRGRRTAVAVLLVMAVTAACDDDREPGPAPATAAASTDPASGAPEFEGTLVVRLVTGLRVFGRGCRQRTERDACTPDGSRTYTWLGEPRQVTLTSARMHPAADHASWVVSIRFAQQDRRVVQRAAERAAGMGGYALLLDDHTGNALQAAAPADAAHGRITVRDLQRPAAFDVVDSLLAAAQRG